MHLGVSAGNSSSVSLRHINKHGMKNTPSYKTRNEPIFFYLRIVIKNCFFIFYVINGLYVFLFKSSSYGFVYYSCGNFWVSSLHRRNNYNKVNADCYFFDFFRGDNSDIFICVHPDDKRKMKNKK